MAIVNPCVSVILPVFNRLHYLRAAVDSVFEQTFHDWELLVADDGSDSDTLEYLRQLPQRGNVRLIRLAHTGNPPAVRNLALREAKGEYIAFLDSDDVWERNKLAVQLASLRSKPTRQWSYTGFRMVGPTLKPLNRTIPFSAADGAILHALLNLTTTVVQSSVIAHRDLIAATGPYDERLPICGDYELWVRFALCAEADCVGEALVMVRRHMEHYCDDVKACEDFVRALNTIGHHLLTVPELLPAMRRRRAVAAGTLARSLAVSERRLAALGAVLASVPYSWAYRGWWRLAASAVLRASTPASVRTVVRRVRAQRRQAQP
jgi:glycosyltransferase involved in cell wall biosynthesis